MIKGPSIAITVLLSTIDHVIWIVPETVGLNLIILYYTVSVLYLDPLFPLTCVIISLAS